VRSGSTFTALSNPAYRTYLTGQSAANLGMWTANVAQDWLVLELTHSSAAVGVTMALQMVPMLLLGVWGGVIADRLPKRRILAATQTSFFLLNAALATITLSGHVRAWHVWGVSLLTGFVILVDNPTRQTFVHEVVPRDNVRNAIALNSVVFHSTRLVGPAVGAGLVAGAGAGWAFAANTLLSTVPLIALARLPRGVGESVPDADVDSGGLREGLRVIRANGRLSRTILLVGTVGMIGLNYPIVLTGMASSVFHQGAGTYGLFNVVLAVGSISGALYAARQTSPSRRTVMAAAVIFGVVQATAALAPNVVTFALLLVPMAASNLAFQAMANGSVQLGTDPLVRGRVMSVYMLCFMGTTAIGAPIVGAFVEQFGVRAGMVLCGAVPALMALGIAAYEWQATGKVRATAYARAA
jgi:MFS family permease